VLNTGKNGKVISVKVQISQRGTAITNLNAPGPATIAVSKLASCSWN
jgi:ribosomal protein S28E/S33